MSNYVTAARSNYNLYQLLVVGLKESTMEVKSKTQQCSSLYCFETTPSISSEQVRSINGLQYVGIS